MVKVSAKEVSEAALFSGNKTVEWNVRLHRPGRGSIHLGPVRARNETIARLRALATYGASKEEVAEYRREGRTAEAEQCICEDDDFDVTPIDRPTQLKIEARCSLPGLMDFIKS